MTPPRTPAEKALDAAVNKVIAEHFDLYFDGAKVNELMERWLKAKLENVQKRRRTNG